MTSWIKKYKELLPDDYPHDKKFIIGNIFYTQTITDLLALSDLSITDLAGIEETGGLAGIQMSRHIEIQAIQEIPDASIPEASIPDASIPDASIPDASIPVIAYIPQFYASIRPGTAPQSFPAQDIPGTVQLIRYQRYRINRPSTR